MKARNIIISNLPANISIIKIIFEKLDKEFITFGSNPTLLKAEAVIKIDL